MKRDIIIEDLKLYYTEEQFKEKTGFTYINILDDDLYNFFQKHCESHKQVINVNDLHEKYNDSFILVNTPDGFQDINDLYIKGPYTIYTIKTPDFSIKCSSNHLIETITGWKHAEELQKGDTILTKNGYQDINYIYKGKDEVTYDFEVMHENHRYWGGNGISSHNTGKSYLACSIVREAQKKGYDAIYIDSEGAIDSKFVSRLGVDPTKLIIKQVSTISETSNFLANILKSVEDEYQKTGFKRKVIYVLDSLGNLTSDKEKEDILAGNQKRDMTKQQEIKAMFRVIATPLARTGGCLIVNSHVYAQVGAYVPTNVLSGGCILPDEKIYTNNGLRPIKNINIGDLVLGYDYKYHKVLNVYNYKKPTYSFILQYESGLTFKFIVSDTHRFLIDITNPSDENSWKLVSELNINDIIYAIDSVTKYKKLIIVEKQYNDNIIDVMDLTVADTHSYVTENNVINHNSGIKYNSSVTLELSNKKLEDKENDAEANKKTGSSNATKNGILVKAKPIKSRFSRPTVCYFQIPFFKLPNPYVGLEEYMTWDNAGVCRGNVLTEKEYLKLSPADQNKCHEFEFEGTKLYALEKDTARGIAVKHLGRQVSFIDFWSDMVFTDEYLHYLDEHVFKPMFELPDQSSFDDLKDIEETLEIDSSDNNEITDPVDNLMNE